mmetsp:Transcript_106240/g.310588  ORF Transcript_106240/g.310588 Transcript_106240/m.310588 type:complete len:251 (+) Transcript_106240:1514-2266(+)
MRRRSCSGFLSSNVAGVVARGGPEVVSASQPQSQPAANSQANLILTLTFCFGVRSPCRATSSTQSRSESSWSLSRSSDGMLCPRKPEIDLDEARQDSPLEANLGEEAVGPTFGESHAKEQERLMAIPLSTAANSESKALVASPQCELRPVRGRPGHMSTTKEVAGLSAVCERVKVMPKSVWWKTSLSFDAISFSSCRSHTAQALPPVRTFAAGDSDCERPTMPESTALPYTRPPAQTVCTTKPSLCRYSW